MRGRCRGVAIRAYLRRLDKGRASSSAVTIAVGSYAVESNQAFQGMRFREWVGATRSPLDCLTMGFTPTVLEPSCTKTVPKPIQL